MREYAWYNGGIAKRAVTVVEEQGSEKVNGKVREVKGAVWGNRLIPCNTSQDLV
jgi:hypothetical protein